MDIISKKAFDKALIVEIELEVNHAEPVGKISLNDRWRAAGKSLLGYLLIHDFDQVKISDINWNLIQIDSGDYYRSGSSNTQSFTFYYERI